ncbi:MAG: division/cell wall cluster transcriptional repressor MraZ [Balneolales bacterium]|nr:division/cell wall cluster transcriptional repressor MraZ [Balneolales bacterium]
MASFKGEYDNAVDNKGRVCFPARLRKYLSPAAQERFTILKGLEKCLYLYPEDRWMEVEAKLERVNSFTKKGRTVVRHFLRSAEDLSLDNQNRIAIPAKLREWAGINDKAIFIGSGDRIEVWSPDHLSEEDEQLDFESYQELFESVMIDLDKI